jgi:hypothetical protein
VSYRVEDEGLPKGYVSRSGTLALCIKVRRGPTAAECAEVGEEMGSDADGLAPLAGGNGRAVPWGLGWLEALANAEPESYAAFEWFAFESAHECAMEYARELLGPGVRLYSDGRSGGWLVIHGGPDADAAREAVALAQEECRDCSGSGHKSGHREGQECGRCLGHGRTLPGQGQPDPGGREEEAFALLAALERFREHVVAAVADFPRAVAWQVCANGFVPAAREYAARLALETAQTELQESTDDLAAKVRAVVVHAGDGFSFAVDALCPALFRFEDARAEVARLEGGGS